MPNAGIPLGKSLYFFENAVATSPDCVILADLAGTVANGGMKVPSGRSLTFHGFRRDGASSASGAAYRQMLVQSNATSLADMVFEIINKRANGGITHALAQIARYDAGERCADPMLVKGRFHKHGSFVPAADDSDSDDGLDQATHYENLSHIVASRAGCHIVTVRNRVLHGGVSMFEVMITVRHHYAHVANFHLPWAEPGVALASNAVVDLP